jgi:hypothetical protein
MSSCIEFYNVTDLPELIDYSYHKYININFFVCTIFILTSMTNICMIGSINRKINALGNRINHLIIPPEYK